MVVRVGRDVRRSMGSPFRSQDAAISTAVLVVLFSRAALAQGAGGHDRPAGDDVEHTVIVGVGGAAELELREGSLHAGPNVMIEWDAIENWLELEVGASLVAAAGGVEVPIDLLVKKPFRLTRWAEFMVGIGPEIVRVSNPTTKATYFGCELALDFMFWPWSRHVGLWIAPEYDLIFQSSTSSGIGSTGGVLFGW